MVNWLRDRIDPALTNKETEEERKGDRSWENVPSAIEPRGTLLSLSPIERAKEELEAQAKINKNFRNMIKGRKLFETDIAAEQADYKQRVEISG